MALVQVTLFVEDQEGSPLEDVRVAIQSSDQTLLLGSGVTEASGLSPAFALEESSEYVVLLSKPWVTFTVPEVLVVDPGPDPLFFTFSGVASFIAPPPDPSLCRVGGYFIDINGEPLADKNITVSNLFRQTQVITGRIIAGREIGKRTNEGGYVEIDLVRGAIVRLTIESTGINLQFVVPNQPTASLQDLLLLARSELPAVALG
jgi:hypothetical protein